MRTALIPAAVALAAFALAAASAQEAHASGAPAMAVDFDLLAGQGRIGARPVVRVDPSMVVADYGLRLLASESYAGKLIDDLKAPPSNLSVGSGSGAGVFGGAKIGALSFGLCYDITSFTLEDSGGLTSDLDLSAGALYVSIAVPLGSKPNAASGMAWELHGSFSLPVEGELVDSDGDGITAISGFGFEAGVNAVVPFGTGGGVKGTGMYFQALVCFRSLSFAESTSGGSVTDGDMDVTSIVLSVSFRM